MNKLILAEFVRMFKSTVFKIFLIFPIALGLLTIFMRWTDIKMNPDTYAKLGAEYSNADGLLFVGGLYIIFAIAVFISIFVGTEYSDGTIRNKIIVGHTRQNIYFSKFIVCAVADVTIHLLYILVVLIFGYLIFGGTSFTAAKLLFLTFLSVSAILAVTALLLFISMSIQSKAGGAVVCLLAVIIMLFSALTIQYKLSEPEYYEGYTLIDEETGETTKYEREKNPRYITGRQRRVYEFLNNSIPASQFYQIIMLETDKPKIIVLADFALIIVVTGAGIAIFRRKNLK